jgi:hypothetical protein
MLIRRPILTWIIPRVLCFFVCAWAVLFVGYSPMPMQTVILGGDPMTHRRGLDEPFLHGFWGPEPAEWHHNEPAYRWTTTDWSIEWPHAGSGFFVSTLDIDTSAYPGALGARLTWQAPPIGPAQTYTGQRRLLLLVRGDGTSVRIAATLPALQTTTDRRALGVVVRTTTLAATTGVWRPAHIIVVLASIVLLWTAFVQFGLQRPDVWLACWAMVVGVSWYFDPLWWMVHITPLVLSVGIATGAAIVMTFLLLPRSAEKRRWWWVVTVALVVVLVPTLSPYLRTSDSAMHARMFFDVLRGNLYQLAELPCEASAWTVPYPPLVYLMATPFGMTTWDRASAWQMLQIGGHIAHVGALLYLIRVAYPSQQCAPRQAMSLVVAAWSLPFFQSIHIGELTNAWGHAVYIVAIASLADKHAPQALRTLFFTTALLAHTGIAVTFVLTMIVYLVVIGIQSRRFPWQLVTSMVVAGSIAVLLYYSAYETLLYQPLKYPGCPPLVSIADRLAGIPTALPMMFVIVSLVGVGAVPKTRFKSVVYVAVCVALLSIAILIVRDQTVRWGMAYYPFGALACSLALMRVRRYGVAGSIVMVALIGVLASVFFIQMWNRIYTYLY